MVAYDDRCSEERGGLSADVETVSEDGLVADRKDEPSRQPRNSVREFLCARQNESKNSEGKYGCAGDARDETADRSPEEERNAVHDDLQK